VLIADIFKHLVIGVTIRGCQLCEKGFWKLMNSVSVRLLGESSTAVGDLLTLDVAMQHQSYEYAVLLSGVEICPSVACLVWMRNVSSLELHFA
jgi:hypothetical protein